MDKTVCKSYKSVYHSVLVIWYSLLVGGIVSECLKDDSNYCFFAVSGEIMKLKDGYYKIAGKSMIRNINKRLDWNLEEENEGY